ncbi:uncharacterized protein LOC143024052 isoform X1 [Oratosquilla oratoria]|uniref:uncharacterized protein LOC143024052 isoform X1 n=1 Tax=Oratosquilla oratoria TaxID=337810 RepID=UPI003F765FCC
MENYGSMITWESLRTYWSQFSARVRWSRCAARGHPSEGGICMGLTGVVAAIEGTPHDSCYVHFCRDEDAKWIKIERRCETLKEVIVLKSPLDPLHLIFNAALLYDYSK